MKLYCGTPKRKIRWWFEAEFPYGKIEPLFVKLTHLPSEQEGIKRFVIKIPSDDMSKDFFHIMAHQYSMAEAKWSLPINPEKFAEGIMGNAKLTMYLGDGTATEEWILTDIWFESINFGELCYSSDPNVDIELTIAYRLASKQVIVPK